ncbi:hypothetical protein C0Q70_06195 [Pomacea canaliculata]|uniref:Uncharacterized protein n=1 Tax=Pomacea canaliculata TaxID=400727 RepID=A0A2T7PNB0_POMCA|nr:hypothetical protein C0Q70_06195 [Pomacea canaliculata]
MCMIAPAQFSARLSDARAAYGALLPPPPLPLPIARTGEMFLKEETVDDDPRALTRPPRQVIKGANYGLQSLVRLLVT